GRGERAAEAGPGVVLVEVAIDLIDVSRPEDPGAFHRRAPCACGLPSFRTGCGTPRGGGRVGSESSRYDSRCSGGVPPFFFREGKCSQAPTRSSQALAITIGVRVRPEA